MLYSNVKVRSQEKEIETGVNNIIELGHNGRRRIILKILSNKDDKTIFFLISIEDIEKIMVPIDYKNRIEILDTGEGTDHYTECNVEYNSEKFFCKLYLLKIKENIIFKIVDTGIFGRTDYICIKNGKIYMNPQMSLKEMYQKFGFLDLIDKYKIWESI